MILFVMVVLGFLIGLLSGGSVSGFGYARFRFVWLLLAGAMVQLLVFTELVGSQPFVRELAPYLYVGALAAGLVAIFLNRHIKGMMLVLLGALLNFVVIMINGGQMPAREASLRTAGTLDLVQTRNAKFDAGEDVAWPQLEIADDSTRLAFLGDVFPIPDGLPFANVVSIGDIFISIGAIIAIVWVMHLEADPAGTDATAVEA